MEAIFTVQAGKGRRLERLKKIDRRSILQEAEISQTIDSGVLSRSLVATAQMLEVLEIWRRDSA